MILLALFDEIFVSRASAESSKHYQQEGIAKALAQLETVSPTFNAYPDLRLNPPRETQFVASIASAKATAASKGADTKVALRASLI